MTKEQYVQELNYRRMEALTRHTNALTADDKAWFMEQYAKLHEPFIPRAFC